jgi:hypothetical protein
MRVLVPNASYQFAGILGGAAIRLQTVRREPSEVCVGYRSDLHRHGLELNDRFSMASDEYALSLERAINQLR